MDWREDEDVSFDAYLAGSNAPEAEKAEARAYVEGFNAADAGRIGPRAWRGNRRPREAIEGDTAARPLRGYRRWGCSWASDTARRAAPCGSNAPVERIRWEPGRAAVLLEDGTSLRAPQVIVTVPLGVAAGRAASCSRPRPASLSALDHLAMGPVQRLVLVFREPFWAPKMSFLFARDQLPGVWWTTSPRASTVLTGWIGGPRALLVPDAEDLLGAGSGVSGNDV